MIARGSTRLTVPVMSSPSRLANWSKTWSRSTSRIRCRTICLAVCAPIRPKHVTVELLGLDQVAETRLGVDGVRLLDRHLGELVLDLAHDAAGAEDADLAGLRVDADMDVLVAGDPTIGGLDAVLDSPDQLLARDLLLGVELQEGTDEVTTHDGLRSVCVSLWATGSKKETWGSPTSWSGRSVGRKYTPGGVDASTARGAYERAVTSAPFVEWHACGGTPRLGGVLAGHVVLEDVDELGDERSPRNVRSRRPSMNTGATGSSKVPGRLIPMSACLDSPGPFTTQPMTATRSSSAPGWVSRHRASGP
jgi:hypothetical protein